MYVWDELLKIGQQRRIQTTASLNVNEVLLRALGLATHAQTQYAQSVDVTYIDYITCNL